MSKPLWCKHAVRSIAIKNYDTNGKLKTVWPCCMMGNHTLRETAEKTYNSNKLNITEDISNLTPEELFNHPRLQQLRDNLKSGIRDSACEICWEQEDRGIVSYRQNSFLPNEDPAEVCKTYKLETIDTSMNNLCNLRCRMCTPSSSNQLMIDYNYFTDNNLIEEVNTAIVRWADSKSFSFNMNDVNQWDWIVNNTDKFNILKMSGGEPFYSKWTLKFLDKCIELGTNEHITLEFHTNGTLFDDKLMKKLSKFKNNLQFSIDGSGKTYEYIRYPATWQQLERSIKKYLEYIPCKILNIAMIMMITNVFNLPEFLRWCSTLVVEVSINYAEVHTINRGVSLRHLSVELLNIAAAEIQSASTETGIQCENALNIINDAIVNNEENKSKALLEIQLFDKSRNQHYGDYLDVRVVNWLET